MISRRKTEEEKMEYEGTDEINRAELPVFGGRKGCFCMRGSPEAKHRPEKRDYGKSPEHPLYFRNYETADRFVSLLEKRFRKKTLYWWGNGGEDSYGAVVSEVEFLVRKKKIAKLYVCCYGTENATIPPRGFHLKGPWGPDSFVEDPSLVQCRYDYPEGEDLYAIVPPRKDDAGFYIGKEYSQPIILDGNLSPELQHEWQYLSDFLSESAKEIEPSDCPPKNVFIDCICDNRYYRIYPSFVHADSTVFEQMAGDICDILRELRSPYYCCYGMIDEVEEHSMLIRPESWIAEPNEEGDGFLVVWMLEGKLEFPMPIETHNVSLEDVRLGEEQDFQLLLECAEKPGIYENEEAFYRNSGQHFAAESVIPAGLFSPTQKEDFVESPRIILTGKVVRVYENPASYGFRDGAVLFTVACQGNEFDAVLYPEIAGGAELKEGNTVSCIYWVQGWPKED